MVSPPIKFEETAHTSRLISTPALYINPEEPLIEFFLIFGIPKLAAGSNFFSLKATSVGAPQSETVAAEKYPVPKILDCYPAVLSPFLKSINLVIL